MPLDPAREWLAAGITGIARGREWDAVATVAGAGAPGDELGYVALPDGSFVVESGVGDPVVFADALGATVTPPYRALAVWRPELWVVGAVAIEVAHLDPDLRGTDLELTSNGAGPRLTIDDLPAYPSRAAALERLARTRMKGPYAARAHRLHGDLWEVSILPL